MAQDKRKIIQYKLAPDEGDEEVYLLTFRQSRALIQTLEYFKWMTRHLRLPDDLDTQVLLNDWVDDLSERLMRPMDFCALMIASADCFLSDEGVTNIFNEKTYNAISTISEIQELIKQINNTGGVPMLPSELTRNLLNCANDYAIGSQVTFLVDYLHDSVEDFFEIFEVGTNANERATLIVKQIPAFGQYFGDLLDSIDKLQSEIVENFDAQWTSTGDGNYRDTLRCQLYCKMLETCEFSIDAAIELFGQRLGASAAYALSIPALLGYFLGGTFSGTLIADFAVYSQLVFLKHLNTFGKQIGLSYLDGQLAIAAHNESDELSLLCDDCSSAPVPNFDIVNSYPSVYPSVLTFIGHPTGEPEQDIWTVTSVTALTNSAYVGYAIRDSSNGCIRMIAYTPSPNEVYAADINCSEAFVNHTSPVAHVENETAIEISGNTRTPSFPTDGTVGSVFTFIIGVA